MHIDTIIDFGCADGELILHLHQFMPEIRFIGYDIDKTMLEKAKAKVPFAEFYSKWDEIEFNPQTTLLNLSSVVHEIFHYSTDEEINLFCDKILNANFRCIVVRDMFKTSYADVVNADWINKILNSEYAEKFHQFVSHWGYPQTSMDVIHFLLKYKYSENWDRELAENYLPIEKENFLQKFEKYDIVLQEYKSLPFIVSQVQKDFDIDISKNPTHLYLIFKKQVY